MASKRRKKATKAPTIFVRWKGTIILAGAQSDESDLRNKIERKLSRSLHRCPYLSMSGLADRYAFQIAWGAKFVVNKRTAAIIQHLDVVYLNPGSHWKWWARWRDGKDKLVITGDYYHEDQSWL